MAAVGLDRMERLLADVKRVISDAADRHAEDFAATATRLDHLGTPRIEGASTEGDICKEMALLHRMSKGVGSRRVTDNVTMMPDEWQQCLTPNDSNF